MATHSSVLAWRIPGMEEPGGLPSIGSHRVGHDWSDLAATAFAYITKKLKVCYRKKSLAWMQEGRRLLLLLSRFSPVRLCRPVDGSLPGSPVPGILQARSLEWVAISFSNAWKWKVKVKSLSCVQLLATSWTAAYQAPPSMAFSRQHYWSGLPLPSQHSTVNT